MLVAVWWRWCVRWVYFVEAVAVALLVVTMGKNPPSLCEYRGRGAKNPTNGGNLSWSGAGRDRPCVSPSFSKFLVVRPRIYWDYGG